MSAKLIDGKAVSAEVEEEVREVVERLRAKEITPGLTAIRVGEDPASEIYVRNKARKAEELGLEGVQKHIDGDIAEEDLESIIRALNEDDDVDGILLQLPLPDHLDSEKLLRMIDPEKDVDGFHPMNVGKLHLGEETLVPCTPAGCIRLIESTGKALAGQHAVVVGRSNIVGKPVAALLLQQNATVTICHSRTRDLEAQVRAADIVVAAVGRPMMIPGSAIGEGAIVIDVGINRLTSADEAPHELSEKKRNALEKRGNVLVGDVDFVGASERASWITPVPGGVGPMTIAMLMKNTVEAAESRRG